MAVKLTDEFGNRANPSSAAYPNGSLKDETDPGKSNDGSPLSSRVGNDFQGFMQSALAEAGIEANGNPDSVDNPQILNSLKKVQENHAATYTDIVYRASGGKSAVEIMIESANVGENCTCENGTRFKRVSDSNSSILDFKCLNSGFVADFLDISDSSSDSSAALNLYANTCPEFNIPDGVNLFVNDEVLIPHANVDILGQISAVGATGSFTKNAVVTIGNYTGIQKTSITLETSKGDATLSVTSTSDFKVGEIITIYDDKDFSFAPQRNYYRAGEHLKISEIVSSTQMRFTEPLYDSYAVGIKVFKLNPKKCNVKSLNVKCNNEAYYCVTLESLADGVVSSTNLSGGEVACLQRNRCYNIKFLNPSSCQNIDDGSTTNYAHYTLSCQKVVDENPNVRAFRHALTLTGRDQELSIPNRECGAIGGSAASYTSQAGVTAVDFHGCTENCFYDDMDIFGGVNIGGKNNRCESRIRQQFQPSIVRAGEMVNFNHNYSGSRLFTSMSGSQGYGQIIDIGGTTNVITSNLESGGLVDFSRIIIDCSAGNPSNPSKFIEMVNRGYNKGDLEVSFAGAKIISNEGQSNWFRINVGQVISGVAFNRFNLKDAIFDGIATRVLANEISCEGFKSVGSSQMSQKAVGLEVFIANGFASVGNVQIEDCNLSPLNVRGEMAIAGTKRAYLGNVRAVNGNQSSGSTTEENSGVALRDLNYAQYNDVLTLGLSVDSSAVNALRANAVSTLIVGSWHASGYANNGLSLAGGTSPEDMKFGNVSP